MRLATGFLLCAVLTVQAGAGENPPTFKRKPVAVKAGDGRVKIEFAVDREADVTVFIEDAKGQVVRHLVAGVLGKNPPPPLKPGLAQSIEWDGRADWGKAAPAGPFKVRVALGLGAAYDKVLAGDPLCLNKVFGIAAGPDGTLYVASQIATHTVNNDGRQLVELDRDGSYRRTLIPLPAGFPRELIEYLGGSAVQVSGRPVPVVAELNEHRTVAFRPEYGAGMAVAPGGTLLVTQEKTTAVCAVPTGNAPPAGKYAGSAVAADRQARFGQDAALAASGDGKWVYAAGLVAPDKKTSRPLPAVYRVALPERARAEKFFGDPAQAGSDQTHLASPVGLAADGRGHLLVADRDNNRVVAVSEKDGSFAGSLAVNRPERVAADPKTGSVYVLRGTGKGSVELVKYAGLGATAPAASLPLKLNTRLGVGALVLDTSSAPPILWVGCYYDLLRIEDRGGKFGEPRAIGKGKSGEFGIQSFEDITVDRYRPDPEIYTRRLGATWKRYSETTGQFEPFAPDSKYINGPAGTCIVPGPDGALYGLTVSIPAMFKFDRAGKCLPWDDPHRPEQEPGAEARYIERYAKADKHPAFARVCMVYMTHTMGVRHDGHAFVFDRGPKLSHRGPKALYEYEPSGRKNPVPVIWMASDNVVGPRFDQQGNIYVADAVKPLDRLVPAEFEGVTGPLKPGGGAAGGGATAAMYGSIVKFSPKGGMIDFCGEKRPFEGEPKLDPGLETAEAAWYRGGVRPAKVTGAEWMRAVLSPIAFLGCNCENVRFDVDPFGRVWYTDLGRCRVGILDTGGNEIAHFGGYGNADSRGPESTDKKLADPDVALAWPMGVAATDRYAYVGDALNRRLLRVKVIYAAEAVCAVD